MPFYEVRYAHADRPESSKAFSILAPDEETANNRADELIESEKQRDPGWALDQIELIG